MTTNRLILPLIINIECDWSLNLVSFVRIGSEVFEDKHVNTFKTGFVAHVNTEGIFQENSMESTFLEKPSFCSPNAKCHNENWPKNLVTGSPRPPK